ncbi:porin [Cognatishimia sp. WU-CL00825]|uniref:porin n=1 Tax=Cognatishimia sp. WU-CL00825 TaxID=3127658 RepID=UPI00310B0238
MKKVLFASTALVMTAGVAAAEINVTGGASLGLMYNGTTTIVINEIDFNIVGSGETDGGVAFGASVDLDSAHQNSVTTQAAFGDPEVFISYNGLKLTVGNIDAAMDQGGLADIGYNGVGVDNIAEIDAQGSHDVRVDYAIADINVAVSVDSSNSDWSIGGNASFDAFTIALGFGETGGADQMRATLGYTAGAIGGKVFFADNSVTDAMGVEVSYTSGDVTVTGVYTDNGAADAFGIDVAYDIGGATVQGGVADVNGTTMADLGISFDF